MDLLARLTQVVMSDQPARARAQAAAELLQHGTGARGVGIYRVAGDMVANLAWSGPAAPAHPTFPVSEGLTGHAVRTGALVVSNDVARDPRYLVNQDDSGSELIVPVLHEGQVLGTLDIESDALGAFSGAEIVRYEQLATRLRPLFA